MRIGKMKISGFILFLLFFLSPLVSFPVLAQKAHQIIAKADRAFFNDESEKAILLYEQALAAKPSKVKDNLKVNYRLGLLYLEFEQYEKAIPVLLQATKLSPKYQPQYTLNLATAYHLNGNFEEAIAQYQVGLANTEKKNEDEITRLNKKITECVSGNNLKALPHIATVQNLPQPFNSPASDHVPLLFNNDKSLVFTSRRSNNPKKEADENILEAQFDGQQWSTPKAFPKPVNTSDHDAATCISADGNTLYIYRYENGGDIYQLKKKGASWAEPEPLAEPINSEFYEPSFYITPDNQYAFFSSDRPDGYGGLDLYITLRQPDGSWSEALNLGSNINTAYDEDAPFIAADGLTLYFSSRGHNSMGGYDLFKATSEGATWAPAQNLGFPVNSPADDIYLVTTSDGNQGFFSSDRAGGAGGKDIYAVTFRSAIATDSLLAITNAIADTSAQAHLSEAGSGPEKVILKGRVSENGTALPLVAQVVLTDKKSGRELFSASADSLSGAFSFPVYKGGSYNLLARMEGYFYATADFVLPETFGADTLQKSLSLNKIKTGAKMVLNNILFELNSDKLNPESEAELDRLYSFMQENAKIQVEISGHTDSRGSAALNQALSLKRAQAVVNYLKEKGISPNRMKAVGFGASKPIATNNTESGRKQNRRTEFKILQQ